jgi:3-deoxy-7-phosphoheptulonate synthase
VTSLSVLNFPTPRLLCAQIPLSESSAQFVQESRATIQAIMEGRDPRLLVVVGPCSIHDPVGAMEYAKRLKKIADRLHDRLFIVMRVYVQKPRTAKGWKGLLYDPDLDGKVNMVKGLERSRTLMRDIVELNLPIATEFLDPITPQYLSDCLSWVAIGARTSESQLHREIGSVLPMPVGFKNGTSGNIQVAIDAVKSASLAQDLLSIDSEGQVSVISGVGNPYAHVVLRGSQQSPNYQASIVRETALSLKKSGCFDRVMIDCSHGNSQKNELQQQVVIQEIADRIPHESAIFGVMMESYLEPGRQEFREENPADLQYGVSITDPCMGWNQTELALNQLAS